MTITIRHTVFHCPLSLIVVYLLLLVLLLNLGFWQLSRAQEKRALINQQLKSTRSDALKLVPSTEDKAEFLRYKKVTVTGHYDNEQQILCDNQMLNGKVGYFVFTPFIIESGKKAILVNRGWIAANPNRNLLPDVAIKNLENIKITISGRINHFPSVGIKLKNAEIPTDTSPAVVQVLNPEIMAKKLHYPLFSFQLELDANMPSGYVRQWQTTTPMPPEKHQAYALQWFALAFALTFLFIWHSTHKVHD